MSFNFYSSQQTEIAEITFAYQKDPLLLDPAERQILQETPYYKYVLATRADVPVILNVVQAIKDERPDSNSILKRTAEQYARIIDLGSIVLVVDRHSRAVGLAGYEKMDDESDHGSGPVVHHQGRKNNYEQFHFKTLGLLKEACGQGHRDALYEFRLDAFLASDCKFAVKLIQI